jgi:hypothetical protein
MTAYSGILKPLYWQSLIRLIKGLLNKFFSDPLFQSLMYLLILNCSTKLPKIHLRDKTLLTTKCAVAKRWWFPSFTSFIKS